eukprot:SAG31_NODE_723_length_12568_cov_3.102494_2_plen_57_part_00
MNLSMENDTLSCISLNYENSIVSASTISRAKTIYGTLLCNVTGVTTRHAVLSGKIT